MVEIDETENEDDDWPKVTESQTTLSQQGSTLTLQSRNIIYYVIMVVENNKDLMKLTVHGELSINFSFHET